MYKSDSETAGQPTDEGEKTSSGKFENRRSELAEAALRTLGQVGYSGASLREIAQQSEYSHGVFHYYFKDRDDLIACAVRRYKTQCATRYDEIVETAPDQKTLLAEFATKLLETMAEESDMHRLWYDLRAQALFNEQLRDEVQEIDRLLEYMVWRIVSRYCELGKQTPTATSLVAYALFDGVFQRLLFTWLSTATALPHAELVDAIEDAMHRLV